MVYPNPFSETAVVRFPNPGHEQYLLILRDATGKTVRVTRSITGQEVEIRRDGLAKGLYLLELRGKQNYRARLMIE